MGTYDFAVSIDEATANSCIGSAWNSPLLQSGLKGNAVVWADGATVNVSWQAVAAPSISFSKPDAAKWASSIDFTGTPVSAVDNSFLVTLPIMQVTVDGVVAAPIAVSVLCAVLPRPSGPMVAMLGVTPDYSATINHYLSLVVPRVMRMAGWVLSFPWLPTIPMPQAEFDAGAIVVGNGRVVVAAALKVSGATEVSTVQFPAAGSFYVLMSRALVEKLGSAIAPSLTGKVVPMTGKRSSSEGSASYSASLTLNKVTLVQAIPGLKLKVDMSASASAEVSIDPGGIGGDIISGAKSIGESAGHVFGL
jgi:hypothetical protein